MTETITLPNVPTASEYQDALRLISGKVSDEQRRMLKVQYLAPGRTMNARQIAAAAGFVNWGATNFHYSRLSIMLSDALNCIPEKRANGVPRWWSILASGTKTKNDGFQWTMHPELAEALEALGWVGSAA